MKKKRNKSKRPAQLRGHFPKKAAAGSALITIIPRNAMAGGGYRQPSDTVNVAGIGVGARGSSNIQGICSPELPLSRPQRTSTGQPYTREQLASLEKQRAATAGVGASNAFMGTGETKVKTNIANIYALCDVDSDFAAYVFRGYPKAKIYSDWREMLEKEKSIDAIVISTPDHNHAPIAAAFMKEKKHVYVEKPMAKTLYECRKLKELAKQYDVVTQMGNQGHATDGTRKAVEWVQSGVISQVREVQISSDRPIWPQGNLVRPAGVRIPKSLNYDVWLGPAPEKPYHPDTCHFNWRGLWDYGTGVMGDSGAHKIDAPIWALGLDKTSRIKVQATSSPYNNEYYPQSELITYEFPERFIMGVGYMPPVKVTWRDGGIMPPRPDALEDGRSIINCTLYIGDKGIILQETHGAVPELVPADPDFTGPEPWLPRTGNIYEDWIDAITKGRKSSNDFSYASKVTEIMLLTNLAVLTQRANAIFEYDVENMKITNVPEANDFLHYEYRQGWTL